MPQVYGECGFEIHRENGEVLLVDRRTWGLGYGMGALAVLAMLLAAVGVLGLVGVSDIRADVPAIALVGIAAGCGLIAAAMLPAYRRRCELPAAEVADAVVLDRGAAVLRERSGNVLARLDSLTVAVRIDWWTRGWMRLVVLKWPGGRRTVLRTWSRRRAQAVAESLRDMMSS